jgi:hypothetical protein
MIVLVTVLALIIAQPAATVSGRVVDDRGVPLAGASVVLAGGPPPGVRPVLTSDDGRFSIAGLAPAPYTITIAKAGHPTVEYGQVRPGARGSRVELHAGQSLDLELRLPRGGAISGRLVDESGNPAPGQRIMILRQAPTGWVPLLGRPLTNKPGGGFRIYGLAAGSYRVVAVPPNASNESAASADGESVTVAAGEERERVTLRASAPVKAMSVTLVPVGGTPDQLRYPRTELRRRGEERASNSFGRRNPDGSFTFDRVPAGEYKAVVIAPSLWGASDIVVDGEHPTTISVAMNRGRRVAGRVVFVGSAAPPPRLSLYAIAADLDGIVTGEANALAQVGPDGTFSIFGLPPGRYFLRIVGGSPDGTWTLASAMLQDTDVSDAPLTVGPEDVTGVEVTLTDRNTSARGRVVLDTGEPADERFVIFYPADPQLRTRQSRRVGAALTTTDGTYELKGLPAGRYAIAVVDELDHEALRRPESLARLPSHGTATLVPGEVVVTDVRVR